MTGHCQLQMQCTSPLDSPNALDMMSICHNIMYSCIVLKFCIKFCQHINLFDLGVEAVKNMSALWSQYMISHQWLSVRDAVYILVAAALFQLLIVIIACASAEADYSGLSARVLVRLSVTMVTGEPVDRSRSNLVGGSKG